MKYILEESDINLAIKSHLENVGLSLDTKDIEFIITKGAGRAQDSIEVSILDKAPVKQTRKKRTNPKKTTVKKKAELVVEEVEDTSDTETSPVVCPEPEEAPDTQSIFS